MFPIVIKRPECAINPKGAESSSPGSLYSPVYYFHVVIHPLWQCHLLLVSGHAVVCDAPDPGSPWPGAVVLWEPCPSGPHHHLQDTTEQSCIQVSCSTLHQRYNGHDGISNHQPCDCLLSRLIRRKSKKTLKLHVTGLCAGNSPVIGEFPAQMASNAEYVSVWWSHHEKLFQLNKVTPVCIKMMATSHIMSILNQTHRLVITICW